MIAILTQIILRNTMWIGATTLWYGWNFIFPSKKEKMDKDLYKRIIDMDERNSKLTDNLKAIKNMIREDLNIPEPINMEEYVYVINTKIEKMNASREIKQ
jgi:hypothetical protein